MSCRGRTRSSSMRVRAPFLVLVFVAAVLVALPTSGARAPAELTQPPVIINIGTQSIKAGFATDIVHSFTIPNVVGRPKAEFKASFNRSDSKVYLGQLALDYGNVLDLRGTIENGVVVHFNDLQRLLQMLISDMGISPTQHAFFITLGASNPSNVVARLYKVFFHVFLAKAVYVGVQGLAEVRAGVPQNGSGVSIYTGDQVTSVVPVLGGGPLIFPLAVQNQLLAGRNVTEYIFNALKPTNPEMTIEVATALKISGLFFVRSTSSEVPKTNDILWTAPNGKVYKVPGSLRWQAPEILFPHVINEAKASLALVPAQFRKTMIESIIICGGNSMFMGYTKRVANELKKLYKSASVIVVERRAETLFNGAGIMARDPTAQFWVTLDDFIAKDQSAFMTTCLGYPAPGACVCNGPNDGCKLQCAKGSCACRCSQHYTNSTGFVSRIRQTNTTQGRATSASGVSANALLSSDFPRSIEYWGRAKIYVVRSRMVLYCSTGQDIPTLYSIYLSNDWGAFDFERRGLPDPRFSGGWGPYGCLYVPDVVLKFHIRSLDHIGNFGFWSSGGIPSDKLLTEQMYKRREQYIAKKLSNGSSTSPYLDFYRSDKVMEYRRTVVDPEEQLVGYFSNFRNAMFFKRDPCRLDPKACASENQYRFFVPFDSAKDLAKTNRGWDVVTKEPWIFAEYSDVDGFANEEERWAGPTFYYSAGEFEESSELPGELTFAQRPITLVDGWD